MTQAEKDEIIKKGVQIRRNTYRGKDITSYYNGSETVNGRDLFKQISDGTFDDIYVGDYIRGKTSGTIWLIADIDNYLNQGYTALTKHHVTIIPAGSLTTAQMNSGDTTSGGYKGSEMYTTLTNVLNTYVKPDFEGHILTYRNLVTNSMSGSLSNMFGSNSGASNGWTWVSRQMDLMSEVNVLGTTVYSSSGYDVGIDNRQYAIFQLKPELINQDLEGNRYTYWLKAVGDSVGFNLVNLAGFSNSSTDSSNLRGVRPRFLID